jgi:hypothetical protein
MMELVAIAIVALYLGGRARMELGAGKGKLSSFASRIVLLVVASWIAENSSVRLYGFYYYDARWSLFIDRVPLAIVLIWPVVIHSAWELGRHLLPTRPRWIPLVGAALVLADASLIEPVAVASGLWRWTEPGLFRVPPIGILGWAIHAGFCMLVLEQGRTRAQAGFMLLTPIATHATLLACWWGLFRWINAPLPAWPFVAALWLVSLALLAASLGARARERIPFGEMLLRVPAATFFFVLLALHGREASLVAWVLAFAPPYFSLVSPRSHQGAVAP